jgi:hypothetical protein
MDDGIFKLVFFLGVEADTVSIYEGEDGVLPHR